MEKIFSTILRQFKIGKFFGEKTVLSYFHTKKVFQIKGWAHQIRASVIGIHFQVLLVSFFFTYVTQFPSTRMYHLVFIPGFMCFLAEFNFSFFGKRYLFHYW